MTLAHPNPNTRFPDAVQPLLAERRQQYVIVDIGARSGVEALWRNFQHVADFIGFDPDEEECARLNATFRDNGHERLVVHPHAIAGRNGPHTFHVTQFPFSSGLYRGNDAWLDRFPFTTLKVEREVEVDAITLDHFCEEAALDHVDFVKIDTEGAEYDVLEGALGMLPSRKVLGIKTELWWDPVAKSQRSFADIDILLRRHGFRFFDLDLHRYSRSTLPAGPLQQQIDKNGEVSVTTRIVAAYGQAWTGDALYFRDPVGELREGTSTIAWDRDALLRLCGLLDVFDYGDCAIEILEAFRTTTLADVAVDPLIDALVPPVAGRILDYATYRELSIRIRQIHNIATFKLSDWQAPPTGYRTPR